tara:strand:+ start:358 stop:621 length:264 start_codon:yes stop_codon:yes gene_type:complete
MLTSQIIGLCATEPDPDIWFPDRPNRRPTVAESRKTLKDIAYAVSICNKCPATVECLKEGMREDNINWGIWGGLLPEQRKLLSRRVK